VEGHRQHAPTLIKDQLGLASTWWETLEPKPDGVPERAHQFLGELDNIGYIVGEETSDDPTGYACIMLFELPNTKINIQNSTQYNIRPAGYDDQRGVIPDFKVVPTYDDYINNFDRVLNYTYWLIDEKIED
jgi:hypothetical protein